jgi:hypothetical protein
VQLDRVRGDAGLTVVVVEESDARHARFRTEANEATGARHLPAPVGRGLLCAGRRRRLGDHLVLTVSENEVEIAVGLGADERDRRSHPEDVPLEWHARSGQGTRRRAGHEVGDRRNAQAEKARSILEYLDRPALDAAGPYGGEGNVTSARGSGNSYRYRRYRGHEDDYSRAPTHVLC